MDLRRVILVLTLIFLTSILMGQTDPPSVIIPGPEPFSVDAQSAVYCIDLLRANRFIQVKKESGKTSNVKIETVWSVFLGEDESYPAGHNRRYDIIVNNEPLDWDNSYIEYGGDMLNLRLLFLYKNQHPPRGLDYRNR